MGEDFERYPRSFEADCEKLKAAGCGAVFAPAVSDMYPSPHAYFVEPPPLANELCGQFRPRHFRGMLTVVLKLLNLVEPRLALFGKKDYQQLALIRGMAEQFNLPNEILAGETVRADDGLALSSRNGYLSAAERQEAPRLYQKLKQVAEALARGRRDFEELELQALGALYEHVVRQANEGFLMAKLDLTGPGDPRHQALLQRYQVRGVPTVVFLDGRGNEHPDLRLVDFTPPEQFLSRLAAVKMATSK